MSELHFLERVEDSEIRRRLRLVMAKLELLSTGKAGAVAPTHRGKPESTPPAEALPDRASDQPPPKDRSLFDWFLWHLSRVRRGDRRRFKTLCYLAERDLERYVHGAPETKRAGNSYLSGTDDATEAKRVIAWYEGVDSLEVAVIEECSQAWVEKKRNEARRRKEDGRPKEGFKGWDDDRRFREVQRLKDAGHGQPTVAKKLGVAKRVIQQYWYPRSGRKVAA